MPMELQLKYAELSIPCAIANLETLKAELQPKLDFYKNLVVTEDGIKAAKDDKAKLNRLKKVIDEQRIAVKKKCLEPYEMLEKECKEVEKPILEAIKAIDDQIKAFDEKERKEKLLKLKTAFYKTTHHDWVNFESVLPEKWANKTEKLEKLIEEINKSVDIINAEYAEITKMYLESPMLTAISDQYKRTRNKAETLAYAVTLEKQYQEEQKHKKELEAKQHESLLNTSVSESDSAGQIIPERTQTAISGDSGVNQSVPKEMDSVTFMVWGEKSKKATAELKKLVEFMNSLEHINYKVIKGGK